MEEKRERPDMNQIKDLMTCPVCSQLFREPKILPCLHSFCTPCLENLVSYDAQQRSSLICPQCRRRVQIPGEGVSSLQTNLFAQNMLTVIALDNSSVNQISCENCISKEPPVSRCTLCRKFLCNFCTTAHRRSRDTVDHQLSTLEDVRSCLPGELAKPLFCSIHKKEKLVLYCESCQSSVCRDCTMMEHRSHKYAFAKEIYNKERGKIAEQLSEARSTGLFLKQGLAAVGEMRSSVDERTRAMIKELNEIFTQCMRTINERYSFLYNQLQNIRNERLLHLDAQKSELEYAFGSIQSSIGFTELTLRNSTQVEVLAMKKYIMDRMKELTGAQYNCVPVADDNIRLTVDGTVMQHLSQLGRIEDTNTSPSASLVKGIDAPVVARQMSTFQVQCYDGRGNPRAKGGDRVVVTVQSTDDSALPIKDEKCFQAQVIDRQNGCYSVTYTPITSGDHLVTVFINGMVVKGSPFSVHVQETALSRQLVTPGSPSISTNDDGTALGDPLLHFVNSSQAFGVEPAHPELKRATEDPDAPICCKKFKLEPNDMDSLPDQLFAHSPEIARIKQEHLESANICEQYIQEADAHISTEAATEACSLSKQLLTASRDPEIKLEDVEPSSPLPPSASRLLTDQLDDLSASHDFKVKFSESGFLTEAIDHPSCENFKVHSPNFRSDGLPTMAKDHIVMEENDSSTVQNHFPDDSPTHSALYDVNTPEPVFHIEKGGHLVDDRNPEDGTAAENHDCPVFESESHVVVSQAFVSEVPDNHESESFVSDVPESHDSQGFVSDEYQDAYETGNSAVLSKVPSNSEERATVSDDPLGNSEDMPRSSGEPTPISDSTTTDKKNVEQGNQEAN